MAKEVYIGIDGVARKIKGGYIGIDGVARKIKKAYIGDANGIARLCWSSGADIRAIFADAVCDISAGRNSSSSSTISIPVTDYAAGQVYYAFVFFNTGMSILKIVDKTIELIASVGSATPSLLATTIRKEEVIGLISSSTATALRTVYGGSMFLLRFPNFSETELDAAFSAMTLSGIDGRNASSTSTITLSATGNTNSFVFASTGGGLSVSYFTDADSEIELLFSQGVPTHSDDADNYPHRFEVYDDSITGSPVYRLRLRNDSTTSFYGGTLAAVNFD